MIQVQLQPELKFKLSRQQSNILYALRHAPCHELPNYELIKICQRFGGRIHELRRKGYLITTGPTKAGGVAIYKFEEE